MDAARSSAVNLWVACSSFRKGFGQNLSKLSGRLFALINGRTILALAALMSPNRYSSLWRRSSKKARIAMKKSAGLYSPQSEGVMCIRPRPIPFNSR